MKKVKSWILKIERRWKEETIITCGTTQEVCDFEWVQTKLWYH